MFKKRRATSAIGDSSTLATEPCDVSVTALLASSSSAVVKDNRDEMMDDTQQQQRRTQPPASELLVPSQKPIVPPLSVVPLSGELSSHVESSPTGGVRPTENSDNPRPKREALQQGVCKMFMEKGVCKYGHDCKFAHIMDAGLEGGRGSSALNKAVTDWRALSASLAGSSGVPTATTASRGVATAAQRNR